MKRIFIAIELPDAVKKEVYKLVEKLRKFSWPVTWEPVEKMHITLRFLGDVTDQELASVDVLLHSVSRKIAPFDISIKNFVAYPNFKFPHAIGLKITDNAELNNLHSLIARPLNEQGIGKPDKHQFSGHVTIGRLKPVYANFRALTTITCASQFTASSIELVASVLKPNGSEYTILTSYPFRG
ncbi:MAG: RNA 2',3'-cyclic phosphodiesterase [Patescibacteria group bacterium]